jgi:hypothetical protein
VAVRRNIAASPEKKRRYLKMSPSLPLKLAILKDITTFQEKLVKGT